MHLVTIKISDADYNGMIEHLATERLGRINVAVVKLVSTDSVVEADAEFIQDEYAVIVRERDATE
jgi:hypothetical protein